MDDICFVGHTCVDEIVPHEGQPYTQSGSAVLCGAMVAARVGRRVSAVVKMAPADLPKFAAMEQVGVRVHVIPSPQTTLMRVIHPTADVDVREMFQVRNAGFIVPGELPQLETAHVHLSGVTDQEFTLELIQQLRRGSWTLSADLQSFVRQVNLTTREISFADVPAKREIVSLLDSVKLDVVEGKLLTGSDDLETAARQVQSWGDVEVMITHAQGVLLRAGKDTFYEKFTNRSTVGRTGRGDTTFAAYLSWRKEHTPQEALRFAAATVSIKMETPGPFRGSLEDVLARMNDGIAR